MTLRFRLSLALSVPLLVLACRSQLVEEELADMRGDGPIILDLFVRDGADLRMPPPDFFVPPPVPDFFMPPPPLTCDEPTVPPTLAQLRAAFSGSWAGVATSPWTEQYKVAMKFDTSGFYSARSLEPNISPAFYYGVDDDSPSKKYVINNILSNGDGMGDIQIYWGNPMTTQGSLEHIRVCANQTHLSFAFWATWLGHVGPILYELDRQ